MQGRREREACPVKRHGLTAAGTWWLGLGVSLVLMSSAMAQRTAREYERHSVGFPTWDTGLRFREDTFCFTRVRYQASRRSGWGGNGETGLGRWSTDYPDSDLNLSYRLHQMTSLRVDPDCRVIDLLDPELVAYPFIYMVEPGGLLLRDAEVPVLRRYLLNGGFLMVDDFWGEREWAVFRDEMRRVFPDREFREIPMEHPLFHCVFDLGQDKNRLQTPNVRLGVQSEYTGVTWERPDARDVHVRGLTDDQGRFMVIACHNTDNGDGWEREGESEYFFRTFSERRAYPLAINIVHYLLTH